MPASTIFKNYAAGQQMADERERNKLLRQQQLMQLDDARKGALFSDARVANSFFKNNDIEGGVKFLKNRADIIKNQLDGDPSDTLEVLQLAQSGDIAGVTNLLNSVERAGVMGGYLQDFQISEMDELKLEEQRFKVKNLRDGKQAGDTLTADVKNFQMLEHLRANGTPEQVATFEKMLKLQETPKLSSKAEKEIIDSQDSYFKSGEQARKMELLADDISKIDIGGGLQSTFSETLKGLLGSQDEVTALRREFNGIRASQAVSNLPPGAASDKDIALALSGFPGENANAQQITSFLRGQAKLARFNEAYNEFKAEYIAENNSPKGFISAWKKKTEDKDYLSKIIGSNDPVKQQRANQVSEADIYKQYGVNP